MKINKLIVFFCLVLSFAGVRAQGEAEGEKKETKLTEVVTTDSVPASELLKRAVNWVKVETPKYVKSSGVTTGSKAECLVSFPVKPKELNPQCDYTGKIQMKVMVECKDSKYRYTVTHIKHSSATGKTSAGSIDNLVPECGSMIMPDLTWKKLKGEALRNAGLVVNDIKAEMQKTLEEKKDDW